jgi:hypothetical protein
MVATLPQKYQVFARPSPTSTEGEPLLRAQPQRLRSGAFGDELSQLRSLQILLTVSSLSHERQISRAAQPSGGNR